MEETVEIGVNDLKNLLMRLTTQAFTESFDKGNKKYGDRWRTTSWTGITGLADSKWDMFLRLMSTGTEEEIMHHGSDMIAWITILTLRGMYGIIIDDKRETVLVNSRDYGNHKHLMEQIAGLLSQGKRVIIE